MEAEPPVPRASRAYERMVGFRADHLGGQAIPSAEELLDRLDERQRDRGETPEEASLAEIEDFERAATALGDRTTPLVPASGLVVAGAGVLARVGDAAEPLPLIAMAVAILGLCFLTSSLFLHAGRRVVGMAPTREDVLFAQARLIRKEAYAQLGALFAAAAIAVLIAAILTL